MSHDIFHGYCYSIGSPKLTIGRLPGRKGIALYTFDETGIVITPLAYFTSVAHAAQAVGLLSKVEKETP